MRKRILLSLAALGLALLLIPADWFGKAPNARCLNCQREFHIGTGKVLCGKCRHVMDAQYAKEHFTAAPGGWRLDFVSYPLTGPIPDDVTLVP